MTDTHRGDGNPGVGGGTSNGTGHDTSNEPDDDDGPIDAVRERYEVWRESIRRRPNVDRMYRIGVGIVGGAIVIGGLGLVPLPGPGWVIVFVGLAILATEFVWAQRTERFARDQVRRWTQWIGRQPIVVQGLIGLLTFAFVLGVLYVLFRITGVPGWIPDGWVSWIPGLTP